MSNYTISVDDADDFINDARYALELRSNESPEDLNYYVLFSFDELTALGLVSATDIYQAITIFDEYGVLDLDDLLLKVFSIAEDRNISNLTFQQFSDFLFESIYENLLIITEVTFLG